MAKDVIGFCKICGNKRKLSKEHIPPSAAFNSGDYKVQTIDKYKTNDVNIWQTKKKQGGHFAYVLCVECNNHTGHWYGGEYKRLAEACAPFANPSYAGQIVSIKLPGLFPLRLFKQALTIICATSNEEMSGELEFIKSPAASDLGVAEPDREISVAISSMPLIRKFILDKEANKLPAPFKLYTYLVGNPAGRATGIVKMLSRSTGASALFTEFAWWPLGWVIVFEGQIKDTLFDITSWSQYKYDEGVAVTLDLPCHWVESKMPLDFRNPMQMAESRAKNQAIIDARGKQGRT
jgi:hypothetical protein